MRGLPHIWCRAFPLVIVMALGSVAAAQQVRTVSRDLDPDQWTVAYSRTNAPEKFEFDSVALSNQEAHWRVAALRAWSLHQPAVNDTLKLVQIRIEAERKSDAPAPNPPESVAVDSPASGAAVGESTVITPPVFSRFQSEVRNVDSKEIPVVAGRRGYGSMGGTRVTIEFDGDGTFRIHDPDEKLINSGKWHQSNHELSFATSAYVYIGNIGIEQAIGIRLTNGSRLGQTEERWSLQLSPAEPLVGMWQLTSRKQGRHYGDVDEVTTTVLTLRMDHSASVEWVLRSTRTGWNAPLTIVDFDRSTANWQVRNGKIHFTNPKVIRNWRGHDDRWSWFDPQQPMLVENLTTWVRLK